jgi:hypothetical protein
VLISTVLFENVRCVIMSLDGVKVDFYTSSLLNLNSF